MCTCRFVPLECVDSILLIRFAHPMCWLLVLCFRHAALCLFATQLASVLDPFHKTEKTITGILRAPIEWQIYIHPSRLTFHFRPGSGAHCGGPVREAEIQGEIQRACSRRGDKDFERADLSGKPYDYEDSMHCVYKKQSIHETCSLVTSNELTRYYYLSHCPHLIHGGRDEVECSTSLLRRRCCSL